MCICWVIVKTFGPSGLVAKNEIGSTGLGGKEISRRLLLAFIYYNDALWDEERFLKQKEKVEWLRVGDSNLKYFQKVVKAKSNRTRTNAITNSAGVLVEGDVVPEVFMSHYKMFLGNDHNSNKLQLDPSLFTSKISDEMAANMVRPVSNDEIKEAIFGIGDDKASGPDGYSSTFFKKAWSIVGEEGKRGLRQGDPMSPYLFNMVMEVLTLLLKRNISVADDFRFHPKCESQQIVNLFFADDLFIFSHASVGSVKVIVDALNEFKKCSGLLPSLEKSTAYFCNVQSHVKGAILLIMPFFEGSEVSRSY
ncbi:uncharacterized protein [Rutidosis leptorrhynchoides]|uniref:uncharacterized protein n=1 Tax=Rutidosis leptorrhynchoides TaxID=125765 RepID=UPI003A99B7C0